MNQKEENLKHYSTMKRDPRILIGGYPENCVFSHNRLACPNTGELCPVVHYTNEPLHCYQCQHWTGYEDPIDYTDGKCDLKDETMIGDEPICTEYTPL